MRDKLPVVIAKIEIPIVIARSVSDEAISLKTSCAISLKKIKMKKIIKKLFKNEKGSYAVLAIIMIPIFLLIAALAVDMSILFAARVELLKASDIAAIEVSKYLDLDLVQTHPEGYVIIKSDYTDYATDWVLYNFNNKFGGSLDDVDVRFSSVDSNINPEIVYVKSVANIPLYFAKIAGMSSTYVVVEGSARIREVK